MEKQNDFGVARYINGIRKRIEKQTNAQNQQIKKRVKVITVKKRPNKFQVCFK